MSVGKLFMTELSPPCRAVMITAKTIGVKLNLIPTNLVKGEHLTPAFIKMNPAHALPTYLDNDGTTIGDSHTIMSYLVEKYAKNDSLYPKDLEKRTKVNQMLHFDSGNVYSLHGFIARPMWRRQFKGISQQKLDAAEGMYEILNTFLEGNTWVAQSETPTIADFSLATSIGVMNVVAPMNSSACSNIIDWLKRCDEIPHFKDVNQPGFEIYKKVLTGMMNNDYSHLKEISADVTNKSKIS